MRFGAASVRNVRKGTENQDSFVASQNPNGSKCPVGVFDGHGERGKEISALAARSADSLHRVMPYYRLRVYVHTYMTDTMGQRRSAVNAL